MKKTMFNIWFKDWSGKKPADVTKEIPGYVFEYDGLQLGVSNYYYFNGKPERGYEWKITELKTGALIGIHAATKKAAIEKLNSFDHWDAVKKMLKRYEGINRNPAIVTD